MRQRHIQLKVGRLCFCLSLDYFVLRKKHIQFSMGIGNVDSCTRVVNLSPTLPHGDKSEMVDQIHWLLHPSLIGSIPWAPRAHYKSVQPLRPPRVWVQLSNHHIILIGSSEIIHLEWFQQRMWWTHQVHSTAANAIMCLGCDSCRDRFMHKLNRVWNELEYRLDVSKAT